VKKYETALTLCICSVLLLGVVPPNAIGSEDLESVGHETDGKSISLGAAVREALGRRPSLKAFAAQLLASKERVGESKSGYLPNLSANYADTFGNSIFGYFLFPGYEFANYNLLTVGLTQTLLDFGRVHSQVRQSWHQMKSIEAQKNRTVQAVIRDVELAYYALLKAQHRVESSRQSFLDARKHLDEARARVQAGVGLRLDITQAKVNYEQARLDLIHEETSFRKARVDLGQAIGYKRKQPFVADEIPEGAAIPSINPDEDLSRFLDSNPDLQADQETIRSREASLDSAKDQNYPSITGSAQYYLAQVSVEFFPGIPTTPFSSVNVGGVLNVPIFEGGLITHQVHEARASLRQSIHQREDDAVRIVANVRDAAEDVREARERLKETRTALDNAQENDRLVEAAYRVGTAHSVDVIDAETALRRARVEVDSARYDLRSAIVQYRYALGTLTQSGGP
jgi:outer membrane protein